MIDQFPAFSAAVHARLHDLARGKLFVVDTVDIFESYLASFPEGTNPMFRKRTQHDCSCCKNFVRHFGKVVGIVDGQIATIWDVSNVPHPYDVVAERMAAIVRQAPIISVFSTKERQYGARYNYDNETNQRWDHFYSEVNDKHRSLAPATLIGKKNTTMQVLRRGLTEITPDAIASVLDLIDANALYRGAEFKSMLTAFRDLQQRYLEADNRETFVWANLENEAIARINNTVMGSLLNDISKGVDLEQAVRMFESKVAPANYKRPTSIITPKMIEAAVSTLNDLGLEGAIHRRFARAEDVSVNNMLFVDNSMQEKMRDGITNLLMEAVPPTQAKNLKNAQPIKVDEFFETIVPQATSIEVLVENKHLGNFVSVTAPVEPSEGKLFQWENDFAWSYDGEVTDSIKQRVKAAGGKINAKLRVSLAWFNSDDLDIHCHDPHGTHIYFGNKNGILDVDMNAGGQRSRTPVENLAWSASRLHDGQYRIEVNNYTKRENTDFGFALEVEADGRIEQYSYSKPVGNKVTIRALTLTVKNGELASVKVTDGDLVGGGLSTEKWGIHTETLVPVDTIMLSPNHWDDQHIGNKHWFFILKGCKNTEPVRGIYNEFLRPSLGEHRKVFEVLGSKTKCQPTDEQLSGVGFSSTRRDALTVVAKGPKINKVLKVEF